MLELHIKSRELWDSENDQFVYIDECDLKLEHSLVSISKWEAKYHVSFINTKDKTAEQTFDYIRMMIIGKVPSDEVLASLTNEQIQQISDYINNPMTATTFSKEDEEEIEAKKKKNKFTTSEEIYYWMTAENIPFECQYWHLNRLIALVKICAIYNKPKDDKPKKLTSTDLVSRRARMEAARKKWKG